MSEYEILPIERSFVVEFQPIKMGFVLNDQENALVEHLWKKACEKSQETLFNGQILSLVSLEENRMIGRFVDYKYFIAQMLDPTLRDVLSINPVGISGITHAGDKILIGQRSAFVTQYKGLFEAAPSGGINTSALNGSSIDYLKAITLELEEETGITPSQILEITPFALVKHKALHFVEICINIIVEPSLQKTHVHREGEYQDCAWMEKSQITEKIKKQPSLFVPLSVFLLERVMKEKKK